jgi:hypothetical protein
MAQLARASALDDGTWVGGHGDAFGALKAGGAVIRALGFDVVGFGRLEPVRAQDAERGALAHDRRDASPAHVDGDPERRFTSASGAGSVRGHACRSLLRPLSRSHVSFDQHAPIERQRSMRRSHAFLTSDVLFFC